ncbi:hypothetical protein ODJ79_28295 [Actinoplanes sp. KI2]|uniref:hypothetical protein n=1 Tax=Actinoplanes sp. KI2 TaxID=2983315 RepID=UPI0021D5AB07|nr:hypothetical protein [Actinoplanes sp. KI2]MCU7727637.1 hypothetical protein [Actinoplanes sp. KI2]
MVARISITLNARVTPARRQQIFEDDLEAALRHGFPGVSATGGGTLASPEGEPLWCDVEFEAGDDAPAVMGLAMAMLEDTHAPKGSWARLDDGEPVPFGRAEGLAIYLNGVDLPRWVYWANPNKLVAALIDALGAEGELLSTWHGPRETALYLYGPSAARMRELTAGPLSRFRLARRCRVVDLPAELPA